MSDQPSSTGPSSLLRSRWVKALMYALGLGLLGGAVYMVVRDGRNIEEAFAHARTAPWWKFAFLLLAPLLNWTLSSAMFTVLTRRYGEVRFTEMLGLIGASWLLNYLPMRPGLIARVAYLKTVRGVAITDSAKIGLQAAACTLASAGIVAEMAIVERLVGERTQAIMNISLVVAACACGLGLFRAGRAGSQGHRWLAYGSALSFRLLDMLVQALRIRVAFDVIGAPIAMADALLLAGPAQIVGLMPIQLGAVEWTVGLLARQSESGFTAALLNRAVDMLVALPVGILALAWLWRARRQTQASRPVPHASAK